MKNVPDRTKIVRKPRGRPRSFDEVEVLQRVQKVFFEKGYSAASLDDLAAAAGLNRPSLYAAFGDKQQLYIAALKHYGAWIVRSIEAILADEAPIGQRMEKLFASAIQLYCAPPVPRGCMVSGTAATEAPTHPEIAAAARDVLKALDAAIERAFKKEVAAGTIKSDPSPAARARLTSGILDTLAVRARTGTPPRELKSFALSTIPAICR